MENQDNNQQTVNQPALTNQIKYYLMETSKWGKFLAIVGYVGMGLMVALGLVVMLGFSFFTELSGMDSNMGFLGFVYIIIAGIYYFPVTYLFQFSAKIKSGLLSENQQSITTGFENLKSLFKFMGIFAIVALSIYALLLLIILPITLLTM